MTDDTRMAAGERLIVALIGLCLVLPEASATGPDELLRRVGADWAKRRKAVSRAKYVADGTVLFKRGCFNNIADNDRGAVGGGDFPPEDQTFAAHCTLFLDIDHGKARKEWSDYSFFVEEGKITKSELANVFDGTVMRQRHLDRLQGIDLLIPKPDLFRYFFFDYNDYAILCAHGIVPGVGNMAVESMSTPPGTGKYAVHSNLVSDGRPLAVLRTSPVKGDIGNFAELWVDVERQSAVVRWATYDNGMVVSSLDIGYGEGERGWWPKKWQLTHFRFGETKVGSVYRFRIADFDADPVIGPELFNEEPKPGMVVRDRGVVYRVDDD